MPLSYNMETASLTSQTTIQKAVFAESFTSQYVLDTIFTIKLLIKLYYFFNNGNEFFFSIF